MNSVIPPEERGDLEAQVSSRMPFLVLLFLISVLTPSARAVGPCELNDHQVRYRGYSAQTREHAFWHKILFCIPNSSGEGISEFDFKFIQIVNWNGKTTHRFFYQGSNQDYRTIIRIKNSPRKTKVPPFFHDFFYKGIPGKKKADTYLKTFTPGEPKTQSASGCSIDVEKILFRRTPVPTHRVRLILKGTRQPVLLRDLGEYTGELSLEVFWKEGIPAQAMVLRQKKGWAPGSPGALYTEEAIVYSDDEGFLEDCWKK